MKKIILITLTLFYAIGCTSQDTSHPTIPSSSKKYQLKSTINNDKSNKTKYLCIRLHLLDGQGTELSQLQTGASDRMKWVVGWAKNNDTVILDSSDIGTYAWNINANNQFNKIETTEAIIMRGAELKAIKYKKP